MCYEFGGVYPLCETASARSKVAIEASTEQAETHKDLPILAFWILRLYSALSA